MASTEVGLLLVSTLVVSLTNTAAHDHAAKSMNPAAIGFKNLPHNFTAPIATMTVQGEMPAWLSGSLYRNGPAWWNDVDLDHWFTGLAMLHVFHFNQGSVSYHNQFIQSSMYKQYMQDSTASSRAGEGKRVELENKEGEPMSINTGVTVRRVAGHLLANTGATSSNEFSPADVTTVQAPFDFDDDMPFSRGPAHAHTDLDGRVVHFYHTQLGPHPAYQLYQIVPGQTERTLLGAPIPAMPQAKSTLFIHSFAMTRNYVIINEVPAFFGRKSFGFKGATFVKEWNARWLVVDRSTGKVHRILESPAFMMYHHVNAFEELNGDGEAEIIVDVVSYPDLASLPAMFIDAILKKPEELARAFDQGGLHQYHIPLSAQKNGSLVEGERLWQGTLEFPTMYYEAYNTRKYRYIYGASQTAGKSLFLDKLVKIDLETPLPHGSGASSLSWEQPNCFPGEPIFVPRGQSGAEDDGVVLSLVLDATAGHSFLLVLDAKSFTQLATAPLTYAVPFGFHGRHYFNATTTATKTSPVKTEF